MSVESPRALRKVKILPKKNDKTVAWNEYERSLTQEAHALNPRLFTVERPKSKVVDQEGHRFLAVPFENPVQKPKPVPHQYLAKQWNSFKKCMPWGVPWVMLANSIVQVSKHRNENNCA